MKKIRLLAIFNFVALLMHIGMSVLAQFKVLSSKDVGEISALYPTLFTPAGYTFSIWGIIYLALTAMCIYHIVMSFRADEYHEANHSLQKMSGLFITNNIATAAWLVAFTLQQIAISEILIIIQLLSLIVIHSRLGIYNAVNVFSKKTITQLPLSIYLGWMSIATIANTAVLLQQIQWGRWGGSEIIWTCVMITIATVITLWMIFSRHNIFYALVFIWALVGILSRLNNLSESTAPLISIAWTAMAVTGIAIIIQLFGSGTQHPKLPNAPSVEY